MMKNSNGWPSITLVQFFTFWKGLNLKQRGNKRETPELKRPRMSKHYHQHHQQQKNWHHFIPLYKSVPLRIGVYNSVGSWFDWMLFFSLVHSFHFILTGNYPDISTKHWTNDTTDICWTWWNEKRRKEKEWQIRFLFIVHLVDDSHSSNWDIRIPLVLFFFPLPTNTTGIHVFTTHMRCIA